jgi:hypothetical protein
VRLCPQALLPFAFLAAANPPAPPPPWTGESGGFTVTVSKDDIRAVQGERIAYSLAAVYRSRLAELERMAQERAESMTERDGDPPDTVVDADDHRAPLSLVGPYLSLEHSAWSYWPGAAHPSAYSAFEAIDLRAPDQPLALDQIFAAAEIRAALLADRVVRQYVKEKPPNTLPELLETLGHADTPCEYGFGEDMLQHFAFYDVVGDKVAVRIALSHGCELARGNLTQLGLLLEVPAALKADLARSRDGSGGFLLKAASVRFKGAGVSLSFQKDLAPLIEAARKKSKNKRK